MVRLEDGARGAREGVPHAEGGRTHVRAHEQRTLPVVEQVAHGIGGVVRNRERRHGEIAHGERLRRLEHAPAVVHAREDRDGVRGVAVRVERNLRMPVVESGGSLAVVGVVVREEKARRRIWIDAARGHAPFQLLAREPAVEQEQRPARAHGERISLRPASKDPQLHSAW